jgi:hypothetical protein
MLAGVLEVEEKVGGAPQLVHKHHGSRSLPMLFRWVYHHHNLETIGLGLVKWRKTVCCVNDNTKEAKRLRDEGDSVSFHP